MTITTATQQFLDKFENWSGVTNYARFTDDQGNLHEIQRASRRLLSVGGLVKAHFSDQCHYEPVPFGMISGYAWSVENEAKGTFEWHWVVVGVHTPDKYYPVPDGHKSLIKEMTKIAPLANWRWFRGGGEY